MKKAWKIAGTFTAWVLAGCITVTSVAIFSKRETVEAKASFNGTADIVAKNSEENPFRILELVPSKTMGEFGYMYDKKACINWEENLKNIKTADERRIYMNETLYNQWKSLFNEQDSDDKDQALSCAKDRYEEQYALETGDNPENWKMIEFPGTDLEILLGGEIDDTENGSGDSVNENTYPGYEMVSDPSGDYCLMSHYEVAPKVDGKYTGNFNQLVEHYVYSGTNNQYYGVKFTAATLTQIDGQWTSGGQTLYSATRKDNLGNEDTFNSVLENTPNAYVYRLGYNDIYGHMECIGKISDDEVTYQNISQDTKNYYYTVEFAYVDLVANPLIGNETYYVADAVEFLVDEQGKGQGEYGANVGAIYTPVAEGEEGYFNQTAKDCFEYVGEGAGTHRMVKNPQAELTVPVKIGKIYYKGGYWSNQFLQKHVFHQDNGSMNFTTTVVEPKEMDFICSSGEIGKYDLLYISESCLIGSEAKDQNGGSATFSVQNDIEWETALSIMMRARQSGNRLSVIVDKTINQNLDYNNVSNVERLVAMITSDQFFEINKGSNLSGADDEDYKIKLSKNTTIVEVPWFELTYQGGNKSYLDEYEFGYVNNNIYVFPGNTGASQNSGVPFLYDQFHTKEIAGGKDDNTFLENAKAKGFGEIADYINTQNLKREMENNAQGVHYDLFDRSITKATVVEYIISYNDEEETVWDSGINILEIQPGKTAGNEATLKADEFKSLFTELSYDIGDVEVTYMTTAEFVGRIEDLSKYDLIYFGLDTTAFNVENGVTKYNDYQMDGLIYSNIGDVYTFWVNDNEAFSGMLDSDYDDSGNLIKWNEDSFPDSRTNKYRNENNTYRLAGNDITKENKEKLLNFIKAGNPIMVDPKFYNDDSTAVNETYIDNCSVMYEFMQEALKYENVVAYDKKDKSTDVPTLMKYFQIGKPNLTILEHEMEPNRTLSQEESLFYAVEEKDNTRYVTLEFQVTNQGAANAQTAFEAYFYIDANSDGKFSATQEAVYPLDMTLTQNDSKLLPSVRTVKAEESEKKEEVNAGESSTEESNTEESNTEESNIEEEVTTEYYYEITPGVQNTYCITYELPGDTYGLIPWKLVVSQKGNKLRSVYKQGYYYSPYADKKEEVSETEKEEGIGEENSEENSEEKKPITIRVLQINTDSTSSFKTTWNMEESLANENSKFAQYMAMVQDFDIKVKTVTSDQYAIDYKAKLAEGKDYFASAVDDEKVDMLVMGFADCYTIKDVTALNGIVEYINSGKPVLFTHDTTSFNNNKNKPGAWGYLYNTMVRNLVGMDRYGVLDNSYVKAGKQLVKDKNANFSELKKKSEELNVDIAYIPKSGKKIIAKHGQGFSYPVGFYYVNQGGSAKVTYWPFNRTVMNGYNRETKSVVQVNEGQITNYPFKIPETFTVANTHAQYYQLDLNEDADLDGESDIAVWYTLTGTSTYDCSPKDVRNNYFIYTKGNVTYSGVGHSSLEGDNIKNDNEIKLYINTMIAAYSVGEKPPKIDLRKEAPMDAEKLKLMYVSFDDTVINNGSDFVVTESEKSIEKLEEEKEKGRETNCVYFTVTDRNIIKNLDKKVVEVRFGVPTHMTEDDYNGIVDPNEKQQYFLFEEEDGTKVCLKEFFPKVTTVDGKKVLAKGTGITYKAKIPADVLGDRKNVTVYAVARTKITQKFPTFNEKGEKVEKTVQKETDPCKATFRIQRMGLMDLD